MEISAIIQVLLWGKLPKLHLISKVAEIQAVFRYTVATQKSTLFIWHDASPLSMAVSMIIQCDWCQGTSSGNLFRTIVQSPQMLFFRQPKLLRQRRDGPLFFGMQTVNLCKQIDHME
jgi:hypothetical protein